MPSLSSDVVGRIKRLPLKPSANSALMPLFEAVSNSLHAVQDRFGDDAPHRGTIEIEVERKEVGTDRGQVSGFIVKDNGIGLTEENFESFKRPDSQHKIGRGGKGIGRLGWLKIFDNIEVESHFLSEGKIGCRRFDFVLAPEEQIKLKELPLPAKDPGTKITLREYATAYGSRCPIQWQTIVERLIGHFLPLFAAGSVPFISYLDGEEFLELKDYFAGQIVEQRVDDIHVPLSQDLTIALKVRHIKAKKAIRSERAKYNWLFLTANDRAVEEYSLDEQLGLKQLEGEYVYFGCASGDYLNAHVNQERNGFTFDSDEMLLIRRALARSARDFLSEYVSAVMAEKQRVADDVITENPQFIYLKGELSEFVGKLPANASSKEDILVEMSRHRFRRQRDFRGLEKEIKSSEKFSAAIAEKVGDYKQFVQEEQKGALAEYVLTRKSVIDLLDKFLGFADAEKERHHLEEAVHALICPMRVDSAALEVEGHNLWLADDRLAFFNFFASDKSFRSYSDIESSDRPDLAFFFDTCLAWRETEQNPNTIVLVEFKRPGREGYSDDENPLRQVLEYVEKFQTTGSLKDSQGRVLNPNIKHSAFHCYIIADMTDGLKKRLVGFGEPTPDGDGLFGYTSRPKAYVEVIPYSKLIRDAKMRNAVFFQKLGLNDHGNS